MLFAVDIGNSNIVLALHDGSGWTQSWRIHTDPSRTTDEYYVEIKSLIACAGIIPPHRAVVSSVVPSLTMVFRKLCFRLFGVEPLLVDRHLKTGLIPESIPVEMGSDLIANLAAAHALLPSDDVVVLDFGTAMTVTTVSDRGFVYGAAIAPGLVTSVKALAGGTAALPTIELTTPQAVMGRTSIDSIRSGILYGFAGLADSMVQRVEKEIGATVKVIVTGGLCQTIGPLISRVDVIERNHTLNGLRLIASLNN